MVCRSPLPARTDHPAAISSAVCPRGNVCGSWPHCFLVARDAFVLAVHAAGIHLAPRQWQRIAPRLGSSMDERQVLHTAVMRSLKEVEPFHDHMSELYNFLSRRQLAKGFNGILHGQGDTKHFPMPVQRPAPTCFQLTSACLQNAKAAETGQRSCYPIGEPFPMQDISSMRLCDTVRSSA